LVGTVQSPCVMPSSAIRDASARLEGPRLEVRVVVWHILGSTTKEENIVKDERKEKTTICLVYFWAIWEKRNAVFIRTPPGMVAQRLVTPTTLYPFGPFLVH
jgi:hypothetical protein